MSEAKPRFYATSYHVIDAKTGCTVADCYPDGRDTWGWTQRVADALNAAEENRDAAAELAEAFHLALVRCSVAVRNAGAKIPRGGTLTEDVPLAVERLAEENRDRPWTGEGPSVTEAGGGSILVRSGEDGDLERAVYTWTRSAAGDWEGWMADGKRLVDRDDITGWRRMPRLQEREG